MNAIELATRGVEKQLDHLEHIKTWAETIKNNGDKITDRADRMRADLAKEIESRPASTGTENQWNDGIRR